jgi:hypothetical protein
MIRRATILTLAGTLLAFPLAAQTHTIDPNSVRRLRPEPCPAVDSILGAPQARPKERAYGYWHDGLSALFSNDPFTITAPGRVSNVLLTAFYRGEGPALEAAYAVQVRFVDRELREGAGTRIVLILDDSLRADLGESDANSTSWSRDQKIDQIITVPVPTPVIRALVVADTVRGTVGGTAFTIPTKALESFRSVFFAAACGTRLH